MLIGEAPARGKDRYQAWPLSGRPAQVLCQMAGIEPHEDGTHWGRWTWALYDHFECRNLFQTYTLATPWRVGAAREQAVRIRGDLYGRVVVCLGRRVHAAVSQALELWPPADFHDWRSFPNGAGVVAIPHPSGLNRLLNEDAERRRCGETLRLAMRAA